MAILAYKEPVLNALLKVCYNKRARKYSLRFSQFTFLCCASCLGQHAGASPCRSQSFAVFLLQGSPSHLDSGLILHRNPSPFLPHPPVLFPPLFTRCGRLTEGLCSQHSSLKTFPMLCFGFICVSSSTNTSLLVLLLFSLGLPEPLPQS